MRIAQIKEHMNEINNQLKQKVDTDCDIIRMMLTEISENAMNINSGQGLGVFLDTRDRFLTEIERQRSEYQFLLCNAPDNPK